MVNRLIFWRPGKETSQQGRDYRTKRPGEKSLKPGPDSNRDLKSTLAMFKKLQKLYKSIDYVEGLDENVINRYCLLHSEYVRLRDTRQALSEQSINGSIEEKVFLTDEAAKLIGVSRTTIQCLLEMAHRKLKLANSSGIQRIIFSEVR